MISDIEIMLNDSTSLYESITNNLKLWHEKVHSQKRFRDEWNEFIMRTRKLIQSTVEIEENFFPKLDLTTNSIELISQTYQKRLDDLMPTVKVYYTTLK